MREVYIYTHLEVLGVVPEEGTHFFPGTSVWYAIILMNIASGMNGTNHLGYLEEFQ